MSENIKPKFSHEHLSKRKSLQILTAVFIGTFMGPLDSSVVNIALPTIREYYGSSIGTAEWVVMSYLLIISSLLLTYGRLGDMYGHKRIYTLGFLIFTVGSLLSGLSPTILLLIIFRAFQAIGAGMMMAMGPAIVTDIAPPKERGKYMGVIAVSVSIALATGPVLGGFLTEHFGWQSIFYINVPIGIVAYFWSNKVIPNSPKREGQAFDIKGAIILFLSLIAILFPLNYAEKAGWGNPYILGLLIVGILTLVYFVRLEKKLEHPMVDLTIFNNRLFSMGNVSALLSFIAQFSVILMMPFYLHDILQLSPSQQGMMFIPMPLTTLIVAPISGIISDKIDTRYLSSLGMTITAFGLWQLSNLTIDSSILQIILGMMTIGLGSGMFQTPNNSAVMGSVPKRYLGVASSLLATMRNLGMVLGIAISGAVFAGRQNYLLDSLVKNGLSGKDLTVQAFTGALHLTFIVAVGLALTAVLTSMIRGPLTSK